MRVVIIIQGPKELSILVLKILGIPVVKYSTSKTLKNLNYIILFHGSIK